jgi:ATP-dependent Lon protease
MLLNLLEGNEIHKVVKKVEYHIKLKLRVFATCNEFHRLPSAFLSRFQRLTLKEYTKEQFIEIALELASQYLLIKDQDRRQAIAEEKNWKPFLKCLDKSDRRSLMTKVRPK